MYVFYALAIVCRVKIRGLASSAVYTMTVFTYSADGVVGPGADIIVQTTASSGCISRNYPKLKLSMISVSILMSYIPQRIIIL
jgi:hypothetical protein